MYNWYKYMSSWYTKWYICSLICRKKLSQLIFKQAALLPNSEPPSRGRGPNLTKLVTSLRCNGNWVVFGDSTFGEDSRCFFVATWPWDFRIFCRWNMRKFAEVMMANDGLAQALRAQERPNLQDCQATRQDVSENELGLPTLHPGCQWHKVL